MPLTANLAPGAEIAGVFKAWKRQNPIQGTVTYPSQYLPNRLNAEICAQLTMDSQLTAHNDN
jgi:hypothetical protein